MVAGRLSATRATVASIVASFFEMFDVPVYWPILVVYFFVLFLLTMRRQIQYVLPSLPVPCALCPLPFYSLRCCALPGYVCRSGGSDVAEANSGLELIAVR